MVNIQFPETKLVHCVFSFRTQTCDTKIYDEFDHYEDTRKLKRYVYRLPEHLVGNVQVGNAVLVHCQTGYQLCEVVDINVLTPFDPKEVCPVVCLVDLGPYVQEIQKEQHLEALKKQLDAEKKRLESLVTYEMIAEKHPEFKKLLDQFKNLGGSF